MIPSIKTSRVESYPTDKPPANIFHGFSVRTLSEIVPTRVECRRFLVRWNAEILRRGTQRTLPSGLTMRKRPVTRRQFLGSGIAGAISIGGALPAMARDWEEYSHNFLMNLFRGFDFKAAARRPLPIATLFDRCSHDVAHQSFGQLANLRMFAHRRA